MVFKVIERNPEVEDYIYVSPGNGDVGNGEDILGTLGIGPCTGITLYDKTLKKGALFHISRTRNKIGPADIVNLMLESLTPFSELEAALAGEGFGEKSARTQDIKKRLRHYNIPIIGEDTKGYIGRSMFLYCDTGKVEVYKQNINSMGLGF